jgi:thymidylate synthase (FAD)
MHTKVVAITQPFVRTEDNTRFLTAEEFIVYCARVSNPNNQLNLGTADKLLKYCIKHEHWSIFEQCSMTVEIQTSRDISAQIIRHKSFAFQEFSQRYSLVTELESFDIRKQADKNRQSSSEVLNLGGEMIHKIVKHLTDSVELYNDIIEKGGARESARKVLPLCTQTTLYMTGSVRSWLHYLSLRSKEDTQLEHRDIANSIKDSFIQLFPFISKAMEWSLEDLIQDKAEIQSETVTTITEPSVKKESPRKNTFNLNKQEHQQPTPEEIEEKKREFYEQNKIVLL